MHLTNRMKSKGLKADAVVFDYGNTLVTDPFGDILRKKANDFVKTLSEEGHDVGKKKFTEAWKSVNHSLNFPFCSHFAQHPRFIKIALEKVGVEKSDRDSLSQRILAVYRSGLKCWLRNDRGLEKVKGTLSELKSRGKRLFILSNEGVDTLDMQISWSGLGGYFEKIVASQKIGLEKPDKRLFRYMLGVAGLPEERVVYVGDDPARDVAPSKEMGMKAVLLEQPADMSAAGWRDYGVELGESQRPDAVIKDLEELKGIIL